MITWIVGEVTNTFDDMFVLTADNPFLPSKRNIKQSVIGRDGQFIFDDGYDNKIITLSCQLKGDSIDLIQKRLREINAIMRDPGKLILDYESDKYYNAQLLNAQSSRPTGSSAFITLTLECDPIAKSLYGPNNKPTWGSYNVPWGLAHIPWGGYVTTFTPTTGDTISIVNDGTYISKPLIKLTADSGNVTLTLDGVTFTYENLTPTEVLIDCDEMVVYSEPLINKIANFSGDFIELVAGTNDIVVTGTFVNLQLEFEYNNCYI